MRCDIMEIIKNGRYKKLEEYVDEYVKTGKLKLSTSGVAQPGE